MLKHMPCLALQGACHEKTCRAHEPCRACLAMQRTCHAETCRAHAMHRHAKHIPCRAHAICLAVQGAVHDDVAYVAKAI